MAAPRYITTASGKTLPDHPDYDENVFRAVEAEWLVHAAREKFCARWVTYTSIGGVNRVQLQKDDGRSHSRRPNPNADTTGYYMLSALNSQPSLLILTVEDMAEAVYRHYLARDLEEENTQKIFNRRFRAKYEGTREEDLNWIIQKIKLRTKEAAQGVLAPSIAPSSTLGQTTNTTPVHHAVQSANNNSRAAVGQTTPTTPQGRRTPSTSNFRQASTTTQYAVQTSYSSRVTTIGSAQTIPSQRQRLAAAAAPVPSIIGTPTRTVPADDNRSSLGESRKRGTTLSMDFSERLPSRPRISESESSLSDYTPTPPARHAPTPVHPANRSASSTTPTSYRQSASFGYSDMRGDSNADNGLQSRSTRPGPRNMSGPPGATSSTRAGKDSTSRTRGSSNSSVNPVARYGHVIDLNDKGDECSGISSLTIAASNRQGNAVSNTYRILGDEKRTKVDVGGRRKGPSTSDGGKQIRAEPTGKSGDLSTRIIEGLNAQGTGSDGLKGSPANGPSKVRKQDSFARSSTDSPKKVEKGPGKASGVVMGGSPVKVNKRYEGGTEKAGDTFTTLVKPAGNGDRSGPGAPGFSISKDGKAPSTPQGPRFSSTNGPNPRSRGFTTQGTAIRNVDASRAPPGLNFRKRDTPNRRYENKPVDSTAHMYNAAPDPLKYSDEWQKRQFTLGAPVGATRDPDTSTPPASKTQAAGSTRYMGGQLSSSAAKPQPAEPAGLIGVLDTIINWPSGNMGSKTAANLSAPDHKASGMNGDMGSGPSINTETSMDFGGGNPYTRGSAASNNSGNKALPAGPSGYRTSGVDYCNTGPAVENGNGNKWNTPTKPAVSASSVNNAAPTESRNFSGSSRNSNSKIGDTPPKGPAAWKNGAAPPTAPRGFRPRSPLFGDSYRPRYAESDGSRVYGRYDDATRPDHRSSSGGYDSRSDRRADPSSSQQSLPYFDSHSRHGYDDRHYDSRYRH
ncbi:hypothetical protein IFR05_012934 [Cadophora sp. M221]|nr:hypothetical protein IFR05_012934 [Cadophora sp. M221]